MDFDLSTTTFSFTTGEMESFIVVTATEDMVVEEDESIVVDLVNPSAGLTIGAANTATVTITDSTGE